MNLGGSKAMSFDFVISADSHLVEPYDLWTNALGAKWGDDVLPRLLQSDGRRIFFTGAEYIAVDEGIISDSAEDPEVKAVQKRSGWDPDARLSCMDVDGIDVEILNATWMLYAMRIQNPELRRDCSAVYNDWAADFISGNTDKFIASAVIPVDDIDWACKELTRVAERGVRGGAVVFAAPPPELPPYRDAFYDRFWQTASDLNVPVVLHIITGQVRDLFTLTDHETEVPCAPALTVELFNEAQPILAGDFILGGILDRFPQLNVALGEYEVSWLPYFAFRLEQMEKDFLPVLGFNSVPSSAIDLLLDRVYYGLVDDPLVKIVTDQYGERAKLMWGSDFPHVRSTFPNTHEILGSMLGDLPKAHQQQITALNAAELFGIDVPAKSV
jgi:predicted TIM-barrel fold metal-dependent hydrolase